MRRKREAQGRYKIIGAVAMLFLAAMIMPVMQSSQTYAAVAYEQYTPSQVLADESLYNTVVSLEVTEKEKDSLSQIDLNKFTNLKELWLREILVEDGSIVDLNSPIQKLEIRNAVVDLSTFDLNDFDAVFLGDVYNIGDDIVDAKVRNGRVLNEEYKINHEIYGLGPYEDEIDGIARAIYEESDGTAEDIIRLVTLYVIEHMDYDYGGEYVGLPTYESIMKYQKGVCVHYAHFEARLLNKLGIFAIEVGGDVDDDWDEKTEAVAHAWDIAWVDGKWYVIDPTWLDMPESADALRGENAGLVSRMSRNSDPLAYYMKEVNGGGFGETHNLSFTAYDYIPEEHRVSRMSILVSNNQETLPDSVTSEKETTATPTVPDTGVLANGDNEAEAAKILWGIIAGVATTAVLAAYGYGRARKHLKVVRFK